MNEVGAKNVNKIISQLLEINLQIKALSFFLSSVCELDNTPEEENYKGIGNLLSKIERELSKTTIALMDSK